MNYNNRFFGKCNCFFTKIQKIFHRFYKECTNLSKNPIDNAEELSKQSEQERTERQKIEQRSQNHAEEHEQAQLSLPDIERQKQQPDQQKQRKQQIGRHGQTPPNTALCAQKIVEQPVDRAEEQTQPKLKELKRDRQLHQPNSDLKKPPRSRSSS